MSMFAGGQYRPLTQDAIEAIHNGSMHIFEKVGVEVHSQRALEIFKAKGARVDFETQRVKVPRSMVEDAIDVAPSSVRLCGREERNDLILEDKRVYLGTGGTALNVLDLETGQKRPSTLEDVRRTARLVDALEHIDFFVLPVYPHELPTEAVDLNRFYAGLSNTTKHVMGGVYTIQGVRDVIAAAEEIAGGPDALRKRPIISMITCVMSPLKMDETYTELLMEVASQGIPLVCPTEPLCGATAPVTLAGNLTLLNVETLSGLILTQLIRPRTPVLYGSVGSIVDMRTMAYLTGAVEMGLLNAGAAQLAQYYGIPMYATAGMSDSKFPDVQAGYEKAMTAIMVALAGANYIHDAAGLLEFAMTVSYEQYVIDNEILGMVKRALKGIEVNEETLALDVIERVGPAGNFLAEEHTVQHMRNEFFFPTLSDRSRREIWEKNGAKDAYQRAREMAIAILHEHRPVEIPDEVKQRIKSVFKQIIDNQHN